jgi:DNA invertase Pin-like site-specific DNA recombinase
MDPAVAALDIAKAGAILANMIESYLAGGAPPSNPEGADHDGLQDSRSTSVAPSLHLHSSVDNGAGPLQPGEHRAPVQSGKQGTVPRLELGANPDPRPGSRPVRCANDREDFKTLVSDVAMGQVGAIFSLEASRLARSNQDWHRLLELCAITGTLVIDEDGCYNPAEFNDGLVLGMKGTFAQAELHIIRARLHGGKLNKAQKGELHFALPVGFVFDDDKIALDPDQEVQGAVRTVFELFERESSAYAVVRRFQELGLRFPRRSYGGAWDGKLLWGRLTHSRVLGILANPSYAGTYVFGRYQTCKQIGPTGEIRTQSRLVPQDEWRVVIPGHHPGYITWDQFLANRQRLAGNRTNCEVLAGPAREGLCLLQGLLLCGICGRRLGVRYTGNGGLYPIYQCNWRHREALSRQACMNVASKPLDDAIAERLVTAVTPLTIELALEALTSLEERDKAIAAQWRRRIERARYDVDLAERRYEAVDPANRLIASTLEKRWNDAMQRLLELEAELANFERQTLRTITAEQKRQILQLGRDFPRLWTAPTTAARDRKRMLRLLIRDITVVKGPEQKRLRLHIRWQGGTTETVELHLAPNRAEAVRYHDAFVARIRGLAVTHDDDEIIALLKRDGLTSSTGKPFTISMIRWIRHKHRIPGPSLPAGTFSVNQVRNRYGVSMWVVYYWIDRGLIIAQRRKPGLPYAITLTDATDQRLRDLVANSARLASPSPNPN